MPNNMKTKYSNGGTPGTKYVMGKYNKDGSLRKSKSISKKKFDRLSNRYSQQDGSQTFGTSTSMVQHITSGKNPRKSVLRDSGAIQYACGGSVSKVIKGSSLRRAELGGTIGDAPIKKGKMTRRKYTRGRGV